MCLVGIPEGSEGPRPTDIVATLLQDLLGLDNKPVLDRARQAQRSGTPRAFINRVNMFQQRNDILCKAGAAAPLYYKGSRISVFPYYTPSVAKRRAAFTEVKKELHSCPGVRFGLFYPDTLRITLPEGQVHKFEDSSTAMDQKRCGSELRFN